MTKLVGTNYLDKLCSDYRMQVVFCSPKIVRTIGQNYENFDFFLTWFSSIYLNVKVKYIFFLFSEEAAIDLLLKKTFGKELKIENESDLAVKLNLSNVI